MRTSCATGYLLFIYQLILPASDKKNTQFFSFSPSIIILSPPPPLGYDPDDIHLIEIKEEIVKLFLKIRFFLGYDPDNIHLIEIKEEIVELFLKIRFFHRIIYMNIAVRNKLSVVQNFKQKA